ncbi:MAG: SGNH/GDSL hydrolase family protein, partial [Candidatus Cloacimonetes bacterium]|nr:SGNH/GDSL hydrolase family protein [Candidatus Cloacimonadota bacterium]
MVLKVWYFAFVLFMIMLLFGVVDSIGVISPQDSMENARQNPISEHNSEIKVSESGKIQVSPTIGDLMSEIPEGNRPIIGINEDGTLDLINEDGTQDLPNDHFIIPPGAQTDNAFKIYVIGDSIAWGNGLNLEDKYYYLVAKELQKNLGEPVEVIVYARSGAPISGEDENSIINQAKKIPNDVDLILVSGGINDVGIDHILDSSIEASSVTSLSAPIEERMENLLRELINKNQHVKIVVTGYYNIIS